MPTETIDVVARASARSIPRLQRWLWLSLAGPVLAGAALWFLRSLLARHNPRFAPSGVGLASVVCSIVTVQFVATVLLVWRLGSPRVQRMPEPDLIDLGPGWFAHPGRSGSTATRHRSRLGLPDVFVASSALSWIEMEAGADLHVCAVAGRRQERPATWTARRLARQSNDLPVVPTQVVDLRPGIVWPTPMNPLATHESTRRRASAFIAACGGYHADREPVALQRKVRT